MKISNYGIAITKRFFEAIDMLKAQGRIRGLQTFTNEFGINRWNLNKVKANPETSFLKTEWLYYLCHDYGISAEWLLLGTGGMLKQSDADTARLKELERFVGTECIVEYDTPKQKRTMQGKVKSVKYWKIGHVIVLERPSGKETTININNVLTITPMQ